MAKRHDRDLDGYRLVFCKRFWHAKAKRYIVAPPGRVFCLRIRRAA